MEEPGTGVRRGEDHGADAARLGAAEDAVCAATAPGPGGGEVPGARDARLCTEVDQEKGADLAPGRLVDPVEAVSSPHEGRVFQIGQKEGSSSEQRVMDVEEEKGGSCAPTPRSLSGPGSSRTCREANGGLLNKVSCAPCGEAICYEDVGRTYGVLGKTTECSQQEGLAGNGSDWGGIVEVVKTSIGDLLMASDGGRRDNEGLSDSLKRCSEQEPCGVGEVGAIRHANYKLQQDGLMPNIEAGVTRRSHEDSVSSISGSIDLSLDGKAIQFAEISGDPVTRHVTSVGQGFQSTDDGFMLDMGAEGSPSQQDSLAGNGGVSSGAAEDLQTCNKVQHCSNEGLPDLTKCGIEQLPCSTGISCLMNNANPDPKRDGLISKVGAEGSLIFQEDLVPSISGGTVAFSSDDKAGQIGESFGCSSSVHSPALTSRGYSMHTCDSAFLKEAPGDESLCSRREVNTSEPDDGDSSDSGKHHSEKLPCDTNGLALLPGANHAPEKIGFLPNINATGSCPLDETTVPSIYGSPIDSPSDRQAGQACCTSENSGLDKLFCDSLGGIMPLGDNGLPSEAFGDENQCYSICTDKELQQNSPKYGTAEPPSERNICMPSNNQTCTNEPCCSVGEPSALCHQDSVVGGSGHLDHLEQAVNTSSSADDKAGSVDFISNANDGESQSQKLTTMFVFRRRNPKRAASLRNLSSDKPDQINKASGGTRKPKKVNIGRSLHECTMSMLPNKITKGRSGMIRAPKSCIWGSLKVLLDGFCPSNGPSTSKSHPTCLGKGGSDSISGQKSHQNIRKSRSSRSAKSKCSTLSDVGHATSELNGQPTFSSVADTDASLGSCREKSYSEKSIHILDSTSEPAESSEGNHTVKLSCIQDDTQQLSSTKETSSAYIHGECAKLSTSEPSLTNANGTVLFHVGFSPDSVLEVASVTCEGNASASHDVMLHERSADAIALNGGGNHPSVLSTSNFGKEQTPSLMNLEKHAKTTQGNEGIRKEEIATPYAVIDNDLGEGKVQALQNLSTVRKSSTVRKPGCKKKDGSKGKKINAKGSTKNSACGASKLSAVTNDSISPDPSELLGTGPPEFGFCSEALTSGSLHLGIHEHYSVQTHCITDGDKGSAFDSMKSPRRKKKDAKAGKKGQVQDPHKKGKNKKKNISDGTSLDDGHFSLPSTELVASHTNEQSNLGPAKNSGTISTDLPGNVASQTDVASVPPPRAAWVCCDDCQKWRCIPTELADIIGPNCRWTCKDNGDKAFADCSIPQEKSNAEINAELELSDASADEADNDGTNSKDCRVPSWTHVRTNVFMHRNRRTQSIDESMVCNCKPPQDGRMGCRDGCLNRMLNIECVKRTCPCGEQCSNQKFQRRSYAKLRWFHSGKKGYGLQLQEDVTEGRFLIEYVGEVLDITSYESRQRYYASKGQKHFYFMALNGGEVIDACTKGNLGRFINHSCSPNCRTEKWMVNGEVCIGIFAMRNIKKGEELTFDYNYVRVSGASPQKCFCGTAKCRGYIGGEISVVDTVNQDDTKAGNYEEMVVDKDSDKLLGSNGSDSDGSHPNIAEPEFSIQGEDSHDCSAAKSELELLEQTGGALSLCSEPENSLEAWSPQEQQDEDVIRTPVHVSRTIESSLQQFPVHGTQKIPNPIHVPKVPNVINGLAPSSDFRSNQVPGVNDHKRNKLKQHRNMKPPASSPIDNEHTLGVEGRLNNLLDRGGGISKRKDATNRYLKLLYLTAAEGDSTGGTSKSVRDLSMILDALLKTTSRSVLLDIINKNGLQMLHNILKQNKSNFHRTPIIRKLLKVLDFLAQTGILTSEHINGGPRFAGFESFRDSMLSLMRHSNIQVQRIARSFRDKWILCNIARNEPTEYPCPSSFAQGIQGTNMAWNTSRRKRKSRWDYRPDEHYKMVGLKIQKAFSGHGEFGVQFGLMRNNTHRNQGTNNYHHDVPGRWSSTDGGDEVPPGFESQQECQPALLSVGCEVAPGLCMERYQSSLSISYGVPVALVQTIGTPDSEGGQCHQKWKVAPGVPFSPFPPLPPYPRETPCPSTSSSQMFQHDGTTPVKHNSSGYCGRTVGRDGRVHRSWRNGPRTKWPYHHQGRRFSSNHHRFEPQ